MKIKVINPNTTLSMTAKIGEAAKMAAAAGTKIETVSPTMGPVSIEGHYDEALAALGVADEIRKGEQQGFDGYVIACFGDPGLLAARELARGPVVGVAEAAMRMACYVATGFSVVTTLQRTVIIAEHLVRAYGLEPFCRRVRATELNVLELEEPGSRARKLIESECELALKEDGIGAIVLGCAGMTDLCADLQQRFGVPVIDGVAAAIKTVEALVSLNINTSKRGDLAYPLEKKSIGLLSEFSVRKR